MARRPKSPVHKPFGMVVSTMTSNTTPELPRVPPVDGKPVAPVDRYEAKVLEEAETFRIFTGRGGTGHLTVSRADALARVGAPDCLVYAITAGGRSCCVTTRTVKVHALLYPKEEGTHARE